MIKATGMEALLCARVCEVSYFDFSSALFMDRMRAIGFENIATVEKAGVEALSAWDDEFYIVCFRGTDSSADWLMDAMASKSPMLDKQWLAHKGFLRSLMIVEREVSDGILSNLGSRKLIVTGHSLGAGMAVLFAMRWMMHEIKAVITFGSPRAMNKALADEFNRVHSAHSLRFVNNNDAVARVPWKWLGYSHVFRQQYFDGKGRLIENYKPNCAKKAWNGLVGRFLSVKNLKVGDGIKDHSMRDYKKLVERNHYKFAPDSPNNVPGRSI